MSKYAKLYPPGISEENHQNMDDYIVIALPDAATLEQTERFAADQERLIIPVYHTDLTSEEIKQAQRFEFTIEVFKSDLFRYQSIGYCGRCLRVTEQGLDFDKKEAHCKACERRPKQIHFAISPNAQPITVSLDAWANRQYPMPGDIETINLITEPISDLKQAKRVIQALDKFESRTAKNDQLYILWPKTINKSIIYRRIHRKRSNEINHPNHIGQVRWYYFRRSRLEYFDTDTPPHWE